MRTVGWVVGLGCLLCLGCQKKVDEGTFAPYVQSFIEAAQSNGHPVNIDNLVVQFGTIDPIYGSETVGLCEYWTLPTPTILIDSTYWNSVTEDDRIILLFHELGHCILNRVHKDARTYFGTETVSRPVSIMDSKMIDAGSYEAQKAYYLNELFNGQDQNPVLYNVEGPK